MGLPRWIKLEVIPDPTYLLPDPIATLEATKLLVEEGFEVLPYINADPILAQRLQDAGAVTVMPLGSPIGSGQGLLNLPQIQIIIERPECLLWLMLVSVHLLTPHWQWN